MHSGMEWKILGTTLAGGLCEDHNRILNFQTGIMYQYRENRYFRRKNHVFSNKKIAIFFYFIPIKRLLYSMGFR